MPIEAWLAWKYSSGCIIGVVGQFEVRIASEGYTVQHGGVPGTFVFGQLPTTSAIVSPKVRRRAYYLDCAHKVIALFSELGSAQG